MCALIQVHHLAVCDKHSGIFAFPLSFIALQFGCRGVVAGISPVLLLTCILSWHLYSGSDHITNWNTYARLSDVTLLNKLTPLATQQSVIGFVGITAKDFLRIAGDRRWSFLIIGKRLGIDPRRLVFSIKKQAASSLQDIFKKKKKTTLQNRIQGGTEFELVLSILITCKQTGIPPPSPENSEAGGGNQLSEAPCSPLGFVRLGVNREHSSEGHVLLPWRGVACLTGKLPRMAVWKMLLSSLRIPYTCQKSLFHNTTFFFLIIKSSLHKRKSLKWSSTNVDSYNE